MVVRLLLTTTDAKQAHDDAFPPLVQLASILEMGFFNGFVEAVAEVFSHQEVVAEAKGDVFPVGVFRLTAQKAEGEVAENGDDIFDVAWVKVVVSVNVVGMIRLSFAVDDNDAARFAHGSSVGEGEGDDGDMGVGLVVGVVDFDEVHDGRS